jgi:hypothetical protein
MTDDAPAPRRRRPAPPDVTVIQADSTIDARAWARQYVATLFELEGVIPPITLPETRASDDSRHV